MSERSVFEKPRGRPVLDGAAFGVYEDDAPRSRVPAIPGGLLAVAALVVAVLVWRAVNTDAELAIPPAETTTTSAPTAPVTPAATVERLGALVPAGIGSCVPPPEQPVEGPPRVILQCPGDGVPESVTFILYESLDDRDRAFDDVVSALGVPPEGTECALGHPGRHDYIGVSRVGRVACQSGGGRVDFIWTSDEAPLLISAGGGGRFGDYYRWWAETVDRSDAAFPVAAEQALLDSLPADQSEDCRRHIDLTVAAGGEVAVGCVLDGVAAQTVSSVRFESDEAMTAWIDERRLALRSSRFDPADDACTSSGYGQGSDEATTSGTAAGDPTGDEATGDTTDEATTTTTEPAPDAGFTDYELAGTSGRVLCSADPGGTATLVWTRSGTGIASIAETDPSAATTAVDLLRWWEDGGHRP